MMPQRQRCIQLGRQKLAKSNRKLSTEIMNIEAKIDIKVRVKNSNLEKIQDARSKISLLQDQISTQTAFINQKKGEIENCEKIIKKLMEKKAKKQAQKRHNERCR